eukprot:3313615-Pyramimonas_sp.AAC.1
MTLPPRTTGWGRSRTPAAATERRASPEPTAKLGGEPSGGAVPSPASGVRLLGVRVSEGLTEEH